jgi:hypothetical protein
MCANYSAPMIGGTVSGRVLPVDVMTASRVPVDGALRGSSTRTRRRPKGPQLVVVLSIVLAIGVLGPSAGAKTKPVWSLKFAGGVAGSATNIKVVNCTESEPAGNQLNPVANFKVGKASYQISIRFDPPLAAVSRPFGSTASSTTTAVNLIEMGKTPANWTTGDGNGAGTLNADLKSGSLKGQLIGLGANGIATTVTGKFTCPTFTP